MLSKRIFDVTFSFIGLIILTPVFIFIGLLIKLIDKNPVIFKQKRVGRGGRTFYIYKFNSIKVDQSTEEGLFGQGDITNSSALGKFLRKTKLNELPQLINVLKGDMSIVGPRPEIEKWINVYPERWARVLKVRPGLTDKASIMFLNEELMLLDSDDPLKTYKEIILPKKLDLYEEYVKNSTMKTDIRIIFTTLSLLLFKNHSSKNNTKIPAGAKAGVAECRQPSDKAREPEQQIVNR